MNSEIERAEGDVEPDMSGETSPAPDESPESVAQPELTPELGPQEQAEAEVAASSAESQQGDLQRLNDFLNLREADRLARSEGFEGGVSEAYYHHMANYMACCKRMHHDPQAAAMVDNLDDLWEKGRYEDALRYANHVFGKPQTRSALTDQQTGHTLGNRSVAASHPFASRADYETAKRSDDPRQRQKAEQAWREWMSSYQQDPENLKTPYPL